MEQMSLNIYNKRKELGLTMEELGQKAGVSKSTINKWEKGQIHNIKSTNIKMLADALNVSPIWLMGMENTPAQEAEAIANRLLKKCDYKRLEVCKEISEMTDEQFDLFLNYYNLYKMK